MKNRFLVCLFFSLFLLFVGGWILPVQAAPYLPDREVVVETVVPSPAGERLLNWRVLVSQLAADRHLIRFHTGNDDALPTTTLTLHADGAIERIEQGEERVVQQGADHFLIQPGMPVPADILPVAGAATEQTVIMEERAGGRVFRRRYRLVIAETSREECVASGWLAADSPVDSATLRAITVYDDKNTEVALQLWEPGGDWWLYEHTPFRRSRLVR
ncbi:MAG: hypothetical protein ACOY4H_08875 [Thermodesulfobacteriota bacterium]